MPSFSFFVVSYEKNAADYVDSVCEQLAEALRGERGIITSPDGILIEQFTVGRSEEGEEWKG